MGTPLSGSFSWNTPNTESSGAVLPSADYNNLVKDVATVYAKPWITVVMTGGSITAANGASPQNTASPLFATGSGSGVTTSSYQNSPASGAGSFTYTASSGLIQPPNTAPGNYRIKAQAVTSTSAVEFRLNLVVVGGGGTLAGFAGKWTGGASTGAGYHEIATLDFLIPFNVSSWLGGTATGFYISAVYQATPAAVISYGDSTFNPSNGNFFTLVQAEFDGGYGTA